MTDALINPYLPDGSINPDSIVAARHARGMTQRQLAGHLHISVRALRYHEAGRPIRPLVTRRAVEQYIQDTNRLIEKQQKEMSGS